MEYEVRYYYSTKELNNLIEKLVSFKELSKNQRLMKKHVNMIMHVKNIVFIIKLWMEDLKSEYLKIKMKQFQN